MGQWQVGQKVIIARPSSRGTEVVERTISKIGRKWITAKGDWTEQRFDHEGRSEHRSGWGSRMWPDLEAYQAHVHRGQRWAVLYGLVRNQSRPPAHVTVEQIEVMVAMMAPAHASEESQDGQSRDPGTNTP
jgi:hypothetical protein